MLYATAVIYIAETGLFCVRQGLFFQYATFSVGIGHTRYTGFTVTPLSYLLP